LSSSPFQDGLIEGNKRVKGEKREKKEMRIKGYKRGKLEIIFGKL
jgi:hypothetical protein